VEGKMVVFVLGQVLVECLLDIIGIVQMLERVHAQEQFLNGDILNHVFQLHLVALVMLTLLLVCLEAVLEILDVVQVVLVPIGIG
jgi:hypothetical protein